MHALTQRLSGRGIVPACHSSPRPRATVVARNSVQDLIDRDYNKKKDENSKPEWEASPEAPTKTSTAPVEAVGEAQQVVKSKKERRVVLEKADAKGAIKTSKGPTRCKEAMDMGLDLFEEKRYQEAIDMFNLALELPGNGAYRLATSPREFSCPSDAEEHAALFNMACCYAQMGQSTAAVTCLEGLLEAGFEDFNTIRTDPDLAPARGAALDALLEKYDGPAAKLKKLNPFAKQDKGDTMSDPNKAKSWIQW